MESVLDVSILYFTDSGNGRHDGMSEESFKAIEKSFSGSGKRKPNILIIDDEPAVRKFLSRVFQKLDLPFVAVESGEQAVDFASKMRFDVAFIDMVLTGMNGVETLRQLKAITPDIRAVVFTGFRMNKMIEDSVELGAKAVMDKPFSLTEIFGVLSRILMEFGKDGK